MQNLLQSTKTLQELLEQHGISSMVIGGIAVAIWGEPRLTRDADLKVLLAREDAQRLINVLNVHYQLLADDPVTTLKQFGFIFTRDPSGIRLDLLLAETSFDAKAIERCKTIEVEPGLRLRVTTPEDLIVYKLISTRPRDHEDCVGIVRRQQTQLDDLYIIDWLSQFERALDDSTLVASYRCLRGIKDQP